MRKVIAKGGYGEHGRSCFLAEYGRAGRFFMVDCGIMDTDPVPWPPVTKEELAAVDYLFLTHCHKDHSGAFSRMRDLGFRGWLVTSAMTCRLSEIDYEKTIFFDPDGHKAVLKKNRAVNGELTVTYGRSGHCPGGLWFYMEDELGSIFFSGDYQAGAAFYACDRVTGLRADLAVIDCAHNHTALRAEALRAKLLEAVRQRLEEGRQVILPVPQYGRGMELLFLLKKAFPGLSLRTDGEFKRCAEKMLSENQWFQKEPLAELLKEAGEKEMAAGELTDNEAYSAGKVSAAGCVRDFDLLLMADTHLKKPANRELVKAAVESGAAVFITGRVKKDSFAERLLKEGKAERFLFPHHQSLGDMKDMLAENAFGTVLPFHNDERVVLAGGNFLDFFPA